MLLKVYRAMMRASTPVLEAYLRRRAARGKEDPARAPERRGRADRARTAGPLVWLHAASVGESLSLLALVGKLREKYPAAAVMVTTGTVTSARLMAERLPEGAFHQYMPVDHPAWVASFLDHWRPDFVIWSESELWPNMLTAIAARKIPAVLLNARMSEESFRRWRWARGSAGEILSAFDLCLGQNAAEAGRLKQLGARDARASANLKYGAPPLPFDAEKLAALQKAAGARPLVLFASTHPGEEELAAEVHLALKKKFRDLLTVIVPRHPQRGGEILGMANAKGLNVALRSAGTLPSDATAVYVADTLGELGLFFRLCKTVVIGGSFADIGGHNPIEPAQLGCTVFYGPQMYNFITINDDFLSAGAAVQVKDAEELREKLAAALEKPADFTHFGAAAAKMTAEKSHVVDDLMQVLKPWLDKAAAVKAAS